MRARGSVYNWCGCRDPATGGPDGKPLPAAPHRRHGIWYLSLELPAGQDGQYRRIRRGRFPAL